LLSIKSFFSCITIAILCHPAGSKLSDELGWFGLNGSGTAWALVWPGTFPNEINQSIEDGCM
jgi:hypothetical protein